MVGHAVLTVVVAEVLSVMEMMREMGNALVGFMNATVVLAEGKIFLLVSFSGCMRHFGACNNSPSLFRHLNGSDLWCSEVCYLLSIFRHFCRNEYKREGSGRGNWGSPTDEIAPLVFRCLLQLA